MGTGKVSTGTPAGLRSFDPVRIADIEYRVWAGYYLRQWPQVLRAYVGLIRMGFGMDWYRTMYGAWLVLRANQLWAPFPDNHPERARACMRRFYALVRLTYGEPANPAQAAELEVEWWRVHREVQYSLGATSEDLVESLIRLYCYLYGETEEAVRQPRCTGLRRWTCPTSGSSRAASPTARCSRWSTRPWSAPTPPCSPPSTTEPGRYASPTRCARPLERGLYFTGGPCLDIGQSSRSRSEPPWLRSIDSFLLPFRWISMPIMNQ